MDGLRVYINGQTVETKGGRQVFYSRREDGPYYRWSYDEDQRQWHVGRVVKSGLSTKAFAPATWKELPVGLKKDIVEHYQD